MKDRIPASGQGGRVSLSTENITVTDSGVLKLGDNSGILYGTLAHADNASQNGSAYNKANVLPYSVTSALGLADDSAEPKDAFSALNNKIKTANDNISTLNNITSGNFSVVSTSDVSGGGDNTPDWRSSATSKNDFLVTVSANVAASSRTLNIKMGSVVFSRSLSTGSTTTKAHIYRTGNMWFCHWSSGALEWTNTVSGESSIVIKAALSSQSLAQGNVVNSLTVYGR